MDCRRSLALGECRPAGDAVLVTLAVAATYYFIGLKWALLLAGCGWLVTPLKARYDL